MCRRGTITTAEYADGRRKPFRTATSLAEYTKQLDVFKDEEGNSVVDTANNKLDEVLNKKPGNTVGNMLEDLKRQPDIIAGELGKSIETYNQGLPNQLTDRLAEFAKKIEAANPGLILEEKVKGFLNYITLLRIHQNYL